MFPAIPSFLSNIILVVTNKISWAFRCPRKREEKNWQTIGKKIIFALSYLRMLKLLLKGNVPSAVNQKTSSSCNAINLSANMSTLINLHVLCALGSLPKRLKSGKRKRKTEEWTSETNRYPSLVPQHSQAPHNCRYDLIPWKNPCPCRARHLNNDS